MSDTGGYADRKKIQSNVSLMILAVVFWGIVLGFVICIVAYFADLFIGFSFPYYLGRMLEWPECLVLGFFISFLHVLCRRTTVTVTGEHVQIQRGLHKWQLRTDSFYNTDTQKKMIGYNIFVIYFVKRYLVFRESSKERKYRIFDVTEQRLEEIIQCIREQNTANLSIEEKIEIQEMLDDETERTEFVLDGDEIYRKERKFLLSVAKLWGVAMVVLVLLLMMNYVANSGVDLMIAFFAVLVACLLIALPFQIMYIKKKSETCPGHIVITSDRFFVGGQSYSYSSVSQVRLTSPRKKSSSIYAVQHYMWIKKDGVKKKYWMGSDNSYGYYRQLCECLEEAFFAYPGKIQY